jgi:hypothetical protein
MHALTRIENIVESGQARRRARYVGCDIEATFEWCEPLGAHVVKTTVLLPEGVKTVIGPYRSGRSTDVALDEGIETGVDWVKQQILTLI